MIQEIIHSKIFLLALTVGVYYGSLQLYKRWKFALFNPLLVSIVVIIGVLMLLDIDYTEYYQANDIINFMLGLSVVALAYLLEQNYQKIKDNALTISISLFSGSIVAILTTWLVAYLMGADKVIIASILPKSTTTAIAIAISHNSGGVAAITSIAVIFAGLFGSVLGPWLLKVVRVKDSVARGLALGAASHAMGTAKAMEMGAVEGAVGGAAIGLMGAITAIIIPVMEKIF